MFRPPARLAAILAVAALGFAATAASTASSASASSAATPAPPADGGGLNQVIDPGQGQGTGRTVIDAGHVDIGPTLNTGQWRVEIHDDSKVPPVWRLPQDVVFQVHDAALLEIPDDPTYEFIGAQPNERIHVVPQTQREGVVWVGWNTQEPNVIAQADLGVTMSLVNVTGPGDLTVFLQSGNFGAPQVLYTTRKPLPQQTWVELNSHTHANWAFTKPGVYLVELEFAADLRDGQHVTARDTLRFAVGDAVSPDEAFAANAAPAPSGSPAAAGQDATPTSEQDAGIAPVLWVVVGVVAAALVVGILVVAVATARAKRRARA